MVAAARPGVRIYPLGLHGQSQTLKKMMNECQIPARGRWPILATDQHPVWLVGHILDYPREQSSCGEGWTEDDKIRVG